MSEIKRDTPECAYKTPDTSEYGDDVVYDKLVRDFIPEDLDKRGVDTEFEICESEEEITRRLIDKIIEEAEELREASPEKLPDELADIYQILLSIAKRSSIDFNSVVELAKDKANKRGEYNKGIILKRATKRAGGK